MSCKLAKLEGDRLIKYTCDQVRHFRDIWEEDFCEENACFQTDRRYMEFKKELDAFLAQCTCNEIPLKCSKCTEEDHDGHFCRCESRNIKLAKQLREKGDSPWQKANTTTIT